MEAEEKARLEEEINAKAEEVAEIQNAVKSKFLSFLPIFTKKKARKGFRPPSEM